MKLSELIPSFLKNKTNPVAYNSGSVGYGYNNFSGGYKSGGAKWQGGLSGDGASTTIDHRRMRMNARSAVQDSPTAKSMVTRRADTVADAGLKLDAMPDTTILGITEDRAEAWSRNVEHRFSMWAKNKKANRSELMSFNQAQRLYQKIDDRDGENFIRLYYSKDRNLLNPLQFEFIDANQIRGDGFTSSCGIFFQDDGIIRDSKGRESKYKIWTYDKNGKYKPNEIPKVGDKSGRVFMLHGFTPEFPGQRRGFSQLGHILQEFQNLTDFTAAQIKKAINQSNYVFAVENDQQDPSDPTDDLPNRAPGGPVIDSYIDPVDSSNPDVRDKLEFCAMPEATLESPGETGVFNLRQGDKFKAIDNSAPSDTFESFVDSFTSYLAASKGMPVEVLKMKFSSNYSASRAALVMFWRVAKIWREEMATDFLNPIYEMWLSEEIAVGRIQAPGWSDPIMKAAWLSCEWYGSPMPSIDPLKESNAHMNYATMNTTTLERVARETNGSDVKSNIIKNKKTYQDAPLPPWHAMAHVEELETENEDG